MSSYYDCSPETNNTKVKFKGYSEKTSDIINNITGIFMLLTSLGVTSLILFAIYIGTIGAASPTTYAPVVNVLSLLLFACIFIIVGLVGMYHKIPNQSIFGFTSVILIGTYTIFLGISGKLKNFAFPEITKSIINGTPAIPTSFGVLAVLYVGLFLLYFLGYGNKKKMKANSTREKTRKTNTASVILSFSLVGATLLVALVTVYINKGTR